jgi:multisubunit Na+/H+ antiporter MnhG subunit
VHYGFVEAGVKALIAIPLLFFGATVAAHALVRAAYKAGIGLGDNAVRDDYKDVKP